MHLRRTAERASQYASLFEGSAHAYWVGLVHDIGKAHPAFQRYLAEAHAGRSAPRCPHAIWGAALTRLLIKTPRHETMASLTLPVDGHHRGLMDWAEVQQDLDRLVSIPENAKFLADMATHIPRDALPERLLAEVVREHRGSPDLWTRMVFSALVDADRVETAMHFGTHEDPAPATMAGLFERLSRRRAEMFPKPAGPTQEARQAIYAAAVAAAEGPPGFYTLTAPTGTGKTVAAMAFALRHASLHGLRRVIAAIPYTSIIEQNARVYRDMLGAEHVLEHHGHVEITESEEPGEAPNRVRLAAERWAHPVVVTTTVQLFESLFSSKPARTRKIHHIAGSVIVLDEWQAFPPGLLEPAMDVLRDLVAHYRVTVVFCTATQPALHALPEAIRVSSREVVPDPDRWALRLRRVAFEYRPATLPWAELAQELGRLQQVLVVLNTRRHARELLTRLMDDGTADVFHLSTLLCSAHRRDVLRQVRERLDHHRPVRLVSTQVVEAGVDLDFPVAYRAVGPVDRILQVAGRCNREGRLASGLGRVVVFKPEDDRSPRGPYRIGLGLAEELLSEHGAEALHDPGHLQDYFVQLHRATNLDTPGVQALRREMCFEQVGRAFRLIADDTVPVVVDYRGGGAALAEAWAANPTARAWREVQPFVVNLYRRDAAAAERERWIEPLGPGLGRWIGGYDELLGVQRGLLDPTDLVM